MEWTKELQEAAYMIIYEPLPIFKEIHAHHLFLRTPDGDIKIEAAVRDG